MAKRDYYDVLGIKRGASDADIKSAFRRLAKEHHPDRNPDDKSAEQKFKEINEAYEVLKDEQKRAAYDQFGHAAFEGGRGPGGPGGFGPDFSSSMSDIFDDLFGEFMGGRRGGGGRQRNTRERGADLRYNMEITLQEAFTGKQAQIRVPTSVTCETCSGSGARAGSRPTTCATCGGQGKVRASQGFFTIERTCPSCGGRGETIDDPCPDCRGQGRQTKERTLAVSIPPGVEDGTRIRLAGEGEAGQRGGPTGDPRRHLRRRAVAGVDARSHLRRVAGVAVGHRARHRRARPQLDVDVGRRRLRRSPSVRRHRPPRWRHGHVERAHRP